MKGRTGVETSGQRGGLRRALVREQDISGARKAIFLGELSGAMAHQQHPRLAGFLGCCTLRHGCRCGVAHTRALGRAVRRRAHGSSEEFLVWCGRCGGATNPPPARTVPRRGVCGCLVSLRPGRVRSPASGCLLQRPCQARCRSAQRRPAQPAPVAHHLHSPTPHPLTALTNRHPLGRARAADQRRMHPTGGQSPTMSANDDEEAVDVFGDDGDTPTATADATPAQSAGAPGAAGRAAAAAAAAAPHDAAGAERTSTAARSSDTHTSGAGDGAHAAAAASNTVLSVAVNPTASAAAAAADSQGSSRSGSSTVSSQRKSDHAKPPRAQVAAAAAEAAPVAALQPPHHAGAAVANPDWEIDAEDAETQDVSAGIGAHAAQSAAAGNGQDDEDEDEDQVEVEDRDVLGGGVDDALAPRSANAHAGHKETEQDEGDGNDEEEDIDITDGDDGQPKARAAAAPAPAATAEDDEEIDVGGVEDIAAASTAMQEDGKEGGEEGDEDEDDIDIVGNGSPAPASAASRKGASLPSAPAHGSGNQEGGGDDDDVDVLNGASPPPATNPRTELRQQPDTPTSLAKRMRLTSRLFCPPKPVVVAISCAESPLIPLRFLLRPSEPKSAKAAPLPCQVAFLMVGLPGSGKSTLRNLIVESFEANGE